MEERHSDKGLGQKSTPMILSAPLTTHSPLECYREGLLSLQFPHDAGTENVSHIPEVFMEQAIMCDCLWPFPTLSTGEQLMLTSVRRG